MGPARKSGASDFAPQAFVRRKPLLLLPVASVQPEYMIQHINLQATRQHVSRVSSPKGSRRVALDSGRCEQ